MYCCNSISIIMENNNPKKFMEKRKFGSKKRKNKLIIEFDENARREFLTGFHKRKLKRKTKAREELEKQLKVERKRIKAKAKEQYMKLLLSQKQLPELTDFVSESIDMGTHSVSVTELSTAELSKKNNWIGINEIRYEKRESEEELEHSNNKSKSKEEFVGMELKPKEKAKRKSNNVVSAKSCKDVKKQIKQQAAADIKKSKVFKKKAQFEKVKNFKLKKRQEKLSRKVQKKKNK